MPGLTDDGNSPLPEFEGVPEEFVEQFRSMQQEIGTLRGTVEQTVSAQEQDQLDRWTAQLHNEQGAFDDRWVQNYLAENPKSNGKDAVDAFRAMLNEYGTPKKDEKEIPPAPIIPRGSGSIIPEQVDLTKLTKDQRLDLMAKALERSREG